MAVCFSRKRQMTRKRISSNHQSIERLRVRSNSPKLSFLEQSLRNNALLVELEYTKKREMGKHEMRSFSLLLFFKNMFLPFLFWSFTISNSRSRIKSINCFCYGCFCLLFCMDLDSVIWLGFGGQRVEVIQCGRDHGEKVTTSNFCLTWRNLICCLVNETRWRLCIG